MQVTCPRCRALADRTYDPPFFRRTKCPRCGYELEEIDAREVLKIAEIVRREEERQLDEQIKRDVEVLMREYREWWLKDHEGLCTPTWCQPIPRDKIPPEGYWRVPATLREWLQILGVKDIDAAEKKVQKTGPFNQWKETAWNLWRRGEI